MKSRQKLSHRKARNRMQIVIDIPDEQVKKSLEESKYIREETRLRNSMNRSKITSMVIPKIKSLPDRFEYYFDNPANEINEENRQKFKNRFSKTNAFIDDTKQNIVKKLKELIEKIEEMEK